MMATNDIALEAMEDTEPRYPKRENANYNPDYAEFDEPDDDHFLC